MMIKFLTLALALTIVSFFLAGHSAFGQTATPTTSASPSPTMTVPTSAPATGFGSY